ncbi:MAG: GLUG motif-containing protein [Anaerohalosphaeraceae bacterium]
MRHHSMLRLAILAVYFCISGALWAGTYSGGDGTSVRPYKISTPADWQTLMTTPGDWGKHFVLTADIDLGGEQTPVGNNTTPFVGRLDGGGYTISNVYIDLLDSDYVGLFGRIGAAGQVKNLKLIEVQVFGKRYTGGLCGANFGQITDCSVTGWVQSDDWYVGGLCGLNNAGTISRSYTAVCVLGKSLYVGGLCGGNYQGTITSCYSSSYVFGGGNHMGGLCGYNFSGGAISNSYATGMVTGEGNNVGGLCGGNSSGTISRCHASGTVMGISSVGGLVGYNFSSGSIYQCYALGAASGSGNSIGGLCGYAAAGAIGQCYAAGLVTGTAFAGGLCGFNSGTVSDCFWDMETSGKSASAGGSGVAGKTTAQMKTLETFTSAGWIFADIPGRTPEWQMAGNRYPRLMTVKVYNYSGGYGTAAEPYNISNVEDLLELSENWMDYNKFFILTADIDLQGYVFNTALIAPNFSNSIFEYNEYIVANFQGVAFTGVFDGCGNNIRNLVFEDDFDGLGNMVIGLFGYIDLNAEVRNLTVKGTIIDKGYFAGILAGHNSGLISNCTCSGMIEWARYIGGIVGDNAGIIEQCDSDCTVSGSDICGGIAGQNRGMIKQCSAEGTNKSFDEAGGLAGYNSEAGTIYGCCTDMVVSYIYDGLREYTFGGLVGKNAGTIRLCYATGSVSGMEKIGGLVGYNENGIIEQCYSAGLVSGTSFVGGFCGEDIGQITGCFWDMETSGMTSSAGGSEVVGKTTAQMQTLETFTSAGWDFTADDGDAADWQMASNWYPQLAWEIIAKYSGGSGTEADPYQIANKQDLLNMAAAIEDYDKHFILAADIDLAGQTFTTAVIARDTDASDWNFQGASFRGTFDGRGHSIMNLTINNYNGDFVGLFGDNVGTIKNLTLKNTMVRGDWYAGLLAGCNTGFISNCFVGGSIDADERMGGITAVNYGLIERCHANCTIYGTDTCGVAIGQNYGQVYRCSAEGSVEGIWIIGGLIGANLDQGSISNCYSTALVACRQGGSPSKGAGGLVGHIVDGTISNCYFAGKVISETIFASLGGLIGINSGECIGICFWDVQVCGLTSGVGEGSSEGILGKTTQQMQTLATFTNAGWDFDRPVWMMCGQEYPKLVWNRPDIDDSGRMDLADFAILAAYWQAADCGFCGGADLTGDQSVDLFDLQVFAEQWLENNDAVSNHVYRIEIDTARDYEKVENADDNEYVFEFEVLTDEAVVGLEFTTPAGKTFTIPNQGVQEEFIVGNNGLVEVHREMGREYEDEQGCYSWFYEGEFLNASSLLDYGDGNYTITVTYEGGRQEQTLVWFGIPGTNDVIPQPTQMPMFVNFSDGSILTTPVTFMWEVCTDPAAQFIWMDYEHKSLDIEQEYRLPINSMELNAPVDMADGEYEACIGFAAGYETINSDGIPIRVGKYTESDYEISIEGETSISEHVFEVEIDMCRDYESPGNGSDDTYDFECEIITDESVARIEVLAPGGQLFEIPIEPEEYEDEFGNDYEMGREFNSLMGRWEWWYEAEVANPIDLAKYGDGAYLITVYYSDGRSQETTAWFGIPGTLNPILQPNQMPVFTNFSDGSVATSPVTFAWQACADPAAQFICLEYEHDTLDIENEYMLPIDSTGLDAPVTMAAGNYEVCLGFETWYWQTNQDGILVSVGKYVESDYWITVQ